MPDNASQLQAPPRMRCGHCQLRFEALSARDLTDELHACRDGAPRAHRRLLDAFGNVVAAAEPVTPYKGEDKPGWRESLRRVIA